MATTVNVLCYKSKTLSNGEHPLMIRICKDGKKKYVSLGVSVKTEHWNFEKNVPKSNCPNREHINILIANKKKEYETEIVKLKSEDKLFTANTLNEQISNSVKPKTVEEAFKEYLRLLQEENRRGYMLSVKQVYNSLIKYNKYLNIHFTDIDVAWLKKYETWLRNNGLAENTIGIRFRTLRTIYNYAIQEDMVKAEHYPFKKYKVSKLNQETAKRALSKEDINRVLQYQTDNRFMRLPIDLFAFTYYMGGQDCHSFDIHTTTKFFFIRFNDIYIYIHSGFFGTKNIKNLEFILQHANHQPGCILKNITDKPLIKSIIEALIREYVNQDLYNKELIQQLINTLIVIVTRNIAKYLPEKIDERSEEKTLDILQYIQNNIYNPDKIKADTISQHFGISQNYLGRYFKKHTNETMQQYIIKYKLKLVENRLLHSEMRINEIAAELGFTDESHLNKLFKKYKGVIPSEFRKRNL